MEEEYQYDIQTFTKTWKSCEGGKSFETEVLWVKNPKDDDDLVYLSYPGSEGCVGLKEYLWHVVFMDKPYDTVTTIINWAVTGVCGDVPKHIMDSYEDYFFLLATIIGLRYFKSQHAGCKNSVSSSKTYLMMDSNTGLVKIGRSVNPKARERTLQSEKPTISMIKVCEKLVEKELHKKYAKKRVRGEWFKLSEDDIEYIVAEYGFVDSSTAK